MGKDPGRWGRIVELMDKEGIPVLPYDEYTGSVGTHGLGNERRAQTLSGRPAYTHIEWTERTNADVTDPATRADFAMVPLPSRLWLHALAMADARGGGGSVMRPRKACR